MPAFSGGGNELEEPATEKNPAAGFVDLHRPLSEHEAAVEADRCYFCHDAPCVTACPTGIDIPLFIRQIQTQNIAGAARTIFDENIFGGICARACPTETLCEEACVRNHAEDRPVRIGLLQRHATDASMDAPHPYSRQPESRKQVAVVGAGPAGLACAHRLALHGHDVTVFDARDKLGGLNEYGIATYKTVDDFAQREIQFLLGIGGIAIRSGMVVGRDVSLRELRADHDALFLAIGLGSVNALAIDGNELEGVRDAIDFIAELRQARNYGTLDPGRRVVVIGGGMTAIDAAVQSRLLGAEEVTIAYRRGPEAMNASVYEQEIAQVRGVLIRHYLQPRRLLGRGGRVSAVEFERMEAIGDRLDGTGQIVELQADRVYRAIGQLLDPIAETGPSCRIQVRNGRIVVDEERRTSVRGIWAGGDCVANGKDLTVAAVEDGKRAAESIHMTLSGKEVNH